MTELAVIRKTHKQSIKDAFPKADAGWKPFGDRILVQLRSPKTRTAAGIHLVAETKDQERWMTTVGKVVALGPLAFKNRQTMENWPEGIWAREGDFVRCPKFGGDRWEVPLGEEMDFENVARFAVFRDHEIMAGLKEGGDPLLYRDYI